MKYKRCCLNADRQAQQQPAAVEPEAPPRGELTLLVETARGVMARTVPSASPLRSDMTHGSAAEAAAHDAAAIWGMPDFVFLPETLAVGSGTRELGDGLVIVGDVGVVVQVKSRETPSEDGDRERSWLGKKASEALSQGDGTIRRLIRAPQKLTNLRGTTAEMDTTTRDWFTVAVLDHPNPPSDVTPSVQESRHPAVVLIRRDWEFLFDQLKSTHAVVEYVRRVAGQDCELGREPVRYYKLAQADADAPPESFHPALAKGGQLFSGPLLPMAPAASGDRHAHEMVRTLLEDIAVTRLTSASEIDRLRILASARSPGAFRKVAKSAVQTAQSPGRGAASGAPSVVTPNARSAHIAPWLELVIVTDEIRILGRVPGATENRRRSGGSSVAFASDERVVAHAGV